MIEDDGTVNNPRAVVFSTRGAFEASGRMKEAAGMLKSREEYSELSTDNDLRDDEDDEPRF